MSHYHELEGGRPEQIKNMQNCVFEYPEQHFQLLKSVIWLSIMLYLGSAIRFCEWNDLWYKTSLMAAAAYPVWSREKPCLWDLSKDQTHQVFFSVTEQKSSDCVIWSVILWLLV